MYMRWYGLQGMALPFSGWDWGDESPQFGSLQARRGCKRGVAAAVALAWLLLESVACICRGHAQHQQYEVHVHAIRMLQGSSMPTP